jgi:lipopolysaccharide transport system ATP-binding protein
MTDIAIRVEGLSKQYRLGAKEEPYKTLRESLINAAGLPFRGLSSLLGRRESAAAMPSHYALNDVTFEVKAGDVVGVIGRNGAGKSTLLKVLSRIVEPSHGSAEIHGRIGSLLEVGTGFHPELTGRENIFLNGVILGMKRREIVSKFDEIVAFAEIEKFLDTPVKRYSSGMYVRLAFAVAAHLEPEILLVDEVLAVGDISFQARCVGKMGDIARQGRTIVFVSHSMAAINALCKHCLLIDRGRVARQGSAAAVVEEYVSMGRTLASTPLSERTDRLGGGRVRFTRLSVLNQRGEQVDCVRSGQDISISMEYEVADGQPIETAYVQITFSSALGQPLFVCLSRMTEGGILR